MANKLLDFAKNVLGTVKRLVQWDTRSPNVKATLTLAGLVVSTAILITSAINFPTVAVCVLWLGCMSALLRMLWLQFVNNFK